MYTQGTIKKEDKRYPELLKKIKSAPSEINYKGVWQEELFENCLAVVGSRKMSSYGRQITERLVTEIALSGITIVSGFMYGIDATAHRVAVDAGGKTIAVMPCGVDVVHPSYQKDLYNDILKSNGLIISEFEDGFLPEIWTYPKRNRIVAGLSKAVLVVEAGEKSGSLITANFAKQFGRKLFAIPGNLTSIVSKGTTQLIKEGASIVSGAEDIINYYGLAKKDNFKNSERRYSLEGLEKEIFEVLEVEPMSVDIISRKLNIPCSKIGTAVSIMQLKSVIFEEKGEFYLNN